ncbi:centrosomal protein of 170 kDa isoform X13 [Canis lupus baileyi]|uniref:centrosomal protein of 170 kDa isoform X11 n=1 Tax=Canis lupus familiaris TaxID=9615 RepID=UPI000BAA0F08|nr:centrosomal protein of 170 kDa isoform X11 [Canis lupus familiaris]XP_038424127.1 centrosomal protein of 170 kDa isoform X11 [Canis lupus familiaris]XP_048968343.1 centrosomal protein of 170 kDa isoform X11 [Canis lupus dingo]|eukprot:XP_022276839.1 centrosomal protein of 170 kDa isoform X11 [Canis lupus familiaris]
MSLTSWFLVSSGGTRHRLPREMIFVGRDDCELMLQSRSVDKQHAVINYDASMDEHLVKDLGSLNGTFVNDVRIPEQTYITLKLEDKLRFGYDTNLFTVVRGEMRVPEEALKHEKFTIQLQLSQKSSESELSKSACAKSIDSKVADTSTEVQHKATEVLKSEEKAMDISAMPRGTPLYGQPSWWGDDEVEDQRAFKSNGKAEEKSHETGTAGNKHDDGTQSDSENAGAHRRCSKRAALEEHLRRHHSEQKKLQKAQSAEKHQDQAVTSSTHHRGGHGVPHGKLLKQKSEEPSVSIPFLQTALLRSSGSLGHRPSQEMDKMLKNQPTSATSEKDNDDDQSDKGTYTIELENPNSEEVEARKMIDKVFGVDDNQDYNRPIINEKHKDLIKDWALSSAAIVMEERKPLSTPGFHNSEEGTSSSGNKRWVSQWASLAANHTRHDQEERIMELSVPVPLENDTDISESGISLRSTGSATSLASQGERRRRTLPQLPNEEKSLESSRAKVITQRSEIGEKQDTELQEKEAPTQAYQKDKQDADRPLSKMSRAVNGEAVRPGGDNKTLLHLGSSSGKDKSDTDKEASVVKQTLAKIQQEQKEQAQWTPSKLSASKNVSGQIDRCREESFKQESQPQEKVPGHSTSKGERVTQNESKRRKAEDVLKGQSSKGGDKKESSKSLVRQGSFTIEKPSPNIPIELIPHINKQTSSTPPSLALTAASRIRERSDSMDTDSSMDTTLILKDTEAVMAFLEAKLREDNKTDEGPDTPSYNRDNSISPESDVDTASTISLVTGETERKSTQKRKSFTSLYKDRCSTGSPSKDVTKSSSSGAREKIEKKTKSRSSDVGSRADGRKFVQSSGRMRQPSVDLTDDDQTSSVPHSAISDIMSSDQETYSCKSHARTPLTSTDEHAHSKLEGSKVTKSKTSPVAPGSSSKSTTLPRPRPTRTSLLRRARLGEVSDSELADADKASVASEVSTTSSTSKPPTGRRNISRIDLLAQPRRTRLGSLSARSDSEATISRSSASSRTAEAIIRSGARLVPSDKFSPRIRANSISRLSDSKVKSMTSAHGSPSVNSRWRRFPTDYASTSEDEFGSNRNSPKHTRLRTSPALKTTRLQSSGSAAMPTSSSFKHRIKEQEDYIRDWTAHREEIARISQDLALIAREINDVAGEIDSVTSSGTAPSTTVSTAATTPGSAIDTREEVGDLHGEMHKLVDRVFDESLNFRKIPPLVHSKTPEGNNCRSGDPRPQPTEPPDHLTITRRRTWSRDEVMGDNLLLSSVFQFSRKIRQSIDKTAGKIRILFKDKDRNWDEIESKLRAESEVPIVKTSSMEISSILQELKRVEKQLQAINAMIDPDGTLEALNNMGFPSAILPSPPKQKSPVNNHSSPGQTPTLCPPEARVPHPAAISVSAEFENAESEADFSIHFNRFNPDGEEEDVTVHE